MNANDIETGPLRDDPADDERTRAFKRAHRVLLLAPGTPDAADARALISKHHDENA